MKTREVMKLLAAVSVGVGLSTAYIDDNEMIVYAETLPEEPSPEETEREEKNREIVQTNDETALANEILFGTNETTGTSNSLPSEAIPQFDSTVEKPSVDKDAESLSNEAINLYNGEVSSYNSAVDKYNNDVKEYNDKVEIQNGTKVAVNDSEVAINSVDINYNNALYEMQKEKLGSSIEKNDFVVEIPTISDLSDSSQRESYEQQVSGYNAAVESYNDGFVTKYNEAIDLYNENLLKKKEEQYKDWLQKYEGWNADVKKGFEALYDKATDYNGGNTSNQSAIDTYNNETVKEECGRYIQ